MTLRVVGAGLGRTGTHSLKLALEQLLGGPCYHMMETFGRPDDIPVWHAAINGDPPDWSVFLGEYVATVDWPAAAFWRELADGNPDAVVLLSSRSSTDAWWRSANDTIFQISQREIPPEDNIFSAQMAMATDMFTKTFTTNWTDEAEAKRAYDAHNAAVRAAVRSGTPGRLASRRQLGTDLRRALAPRARRAVPARQQHRRLPGHDRPRRLRESEPASKWADNRATSTPERGSAWFRRGGAARPASAGRPGRAGCRAGATPRSRRRRRARRPAR